MTNLLLARMVGAALLSIGGTSLIMRNKTKDAYVTMLTLKLLWSGAVIVSILISLSEGAPRTTWAFLLIFIVFFLVWSFYFKKLKGILV